MKQRSKRFNNIQAVAVLILSMAISACNGQHNNQDLQENPQSEEPPKQTSYWASDFSDQISQVVRMVFQDSKGTIWFGTQNGAFKLSGDSLMYIDGIQSESGKVVTIKDIAEGQDGKIWFGHTAGISSLDGGKVENYYESDGLISHDVWNIETDAHGQVWIGTIEGLCRFDGQAFTPIDLPEGKIDSTLGISSTNMVHCILEDRTDAIWICTNAGLFKLTDNTLIHVSKEVGIQSNFVNEIVEDQHGAFWISTKQALYRLKGDTLDNITKEFSDVGKGIGSIAEDKDGTIWFVFNQHQLYSYDGDKLIEFQKSEDNPGPVIYQIFKDQSDRLWFVGFGGAYRLENGEFLNITKEGPW